MNASVIEGISWVLDYHDLAVDEKRLGYAMAETTPRQVRLLAVTRREQGHKGSLSVQIANVLVQLYNKTRGNGGKLALVDSGATR